MANKIETICTNYYKTPITDVEKQKFRYEYTHKMIELINQIEKGEGEIIKTR